MQKIVSKVNNGLKGEIEIPADKSISHRAVILSSLAKGTSIIKNFSDGQDPQSTLKIFKNLGTEVEQEGNILKISSDGKLKPNTHNTFSCDNSGTTMRLLSGVFARQNFDSILIGDESLSKRPMKRIIEPLTLMGAKIEAKDYKAPLKIYGKELRPINYTSKIASAQVKSCILLAGLGTDGITTVNEPYLSRNHTEIMLKAMGADITTNKNTVSIKKSELEPLNINICGDISSAAYFIVAGLIVPNSKILLNNVGLNPTRAGIIDVVKEMGGSIEILDENVVSGEVVGNIKVKTSHLKGCKICGEIIPRLIDELPIIAVLATQADGDTVISNAQDLRNKESDRISTVVKELKKLGANIEETQDGMIIHGKTKLKGGVELETYHDHRLAMSLYVAGLICEKEVLINGFEWVNISFPTFEALFAKIVS